MSYKKNKNAYIKSRMASAKSWNERKDAWAARDAQEMALVAACEVAESAGDEDAQYEAKKALRDHNSDWSLAEFTEKNGSRP